MLLAKSYSHDAPFASEEHKATLRGEINAGLLELRGMLLSQEKIQAKLARKDALKAMGDYWKSWRKK